jgi:hypothetical protein
MASLRGDKSIPAFETRQAHLHPIHTAIQIDCTGEQVCSVSLHLGGANLHHMNPSIKAGYAAPAFEEPCQRIQQHSRSPMKETSWAKVVVLHTIPLADDGEVLVAEPAGAAWPALMAGSVRWKTRFSPLKPGGAIFAVGMANVCCSARIPFAWWFMVLKVALVATKATPEGFNCH